MKLISLKQYDDNSIEAKYLAQVCKNGGLIQDSFITSGAATCLLNDNTPHEGDAPIFVAIIKSALQGSPVWGADWGARLYGVTLGALGLYIADIGPVLAGDGKPEGHGLYLNPSGPVQVQDGVVTRCAANALQLAVRRGINPEGNVALWERGSGCKNVYVKNWQIIENHQVMSDRAGGLFSFYGLDADCHAVLQDIIVVETQASVFNKPQCGSVGFLNVTPNYGDPPEGWKQINHIDEYVMDLLEVRHSYLKMRCPSQDTMFLNGVKRLAVLNNVFDFAGDVGGAQINLDPQGHFGGKVREIVLAGNSVINAGAGRMPVKVGGKELTWVGKDAEWHYSDGAIVIGGQK